MSLHISLLEEKHSQNITHNLNKMAEAVGLYKPLWHPSSNGFWIAEDLIEPLERGLTLLNNNPEHYIQFNAPNNWGTYENFVPWLENLLAKCKEFPECHIEVSI